MPSAPLAISSQSKKKLRSSSLTAKSDIQNRNKENVVPQGIARAVKEPTVKHASQQQEQHFEPTFPQTPATKIPLADLLGNTEDVFNCAPVLATPSDHVLWQRGPRSSNPSSSFRSTPRGKKRARSSSPSSSSQLEKSNHFSARKEPLDLENLHKSLRTPQNDPTVDLWNRYTNANTNAKGDSALPAFAHLMPSSPQTPSTTNSKDGGLRRTASCGIEWPTSKAKRRRVDAGESYGRTRDIFAASKREILAPELPKTSRVSLLVEKIQESLARRPTAEADGPSSSSPLPERNGVMEEPESPVPKRAQAMATIMEDQIQNFHPSAMYIDNTTCGRRDDDSSEFGDDDIDFNLLESFERAATKTVQQEAETVTARGAFQSDGAASQQRFDNLDEKQRTPSTESARNIDRHNQTGARNAPCEEVSVSPKNRTFTLPENSDDEFGDDDVTFTNELQDLVAQYDSQGNVPHAEAVMISTATPNAKQEPQNLGAAKDDEFDEFDDGDDLWKDMDESAVVQQGPGVGSASQKRFDNRTIKRYLILDVVESQYQDTRGRKRPEKMLSVKNEKTSMLKIVLLRQSWYDSRCTKGSYIHLIGDFDRSGQCVVDDADNMIILHPDHLISATVVADSFTCTRRAALQDRVKATGLAEKPQVYGHILHEVFGLALAANQWDTESLKAIIEKVLTNYIESLYEINVRAPEAIDYLMGKTPELKAWASVFVSPKPTPDAIIRDRNGEVAWMAVNKLLALEEHVWSPMYGLKGNIDATIQVAMKAPGEDVSRTLTIPFELKTGKKDSNENHRAQTALYTLLLSDRYDINVTCGVLYYMETSKSFRIEGVRNEIRHMIMQRNELACYVRDKLDLPPMAQKKHLCKSCFAKTSCFTYHKLVENGDGETSGVHEIFDQEVGHLTPAHQVFFKKWDDLLTKEERDAMKFRRELWTMLSHEREAVGRCFANVIIEPGSAQENSDGPKINRFQYAFIKSKPTPGFSFTQSQLVVGEPIVISDEEGHFALANGYVTKVRPNRFVVAVDRRLHDVRQKGRHFDSHTNQVFNGIMDVSASGSSGSSFSSDFADPMLYRIDKDEFSNGMATARNNIIRMMEKGLFRALELRQLIIENREPSFKPNSTAYTLSGPPSQADLNVDQRCAIDKVMSAKDYALVLGMPGTGKTTTIAHIIRALVSQNKSVLLTSYTHTAVDNILLKIKDDNIPILRLGAVTKVHPEVQKFADLGGKPKKTIAELENSYVNSKVVATTCLGINDRIFNSRIFDYCIVDEASQITLPVCLGPIRMAKTFILVGDHFQLPPLVQNKEAQEGGLDVSLFKLLSDAHPDSVVNLEHQYRMAADIMLLSNELIYAGRLKCGTQAVAERRLKIPGLETGLAAHHHTSSSISRPATPSTICLSTSACWIRRALTPQARCLFLNTDTLGQIARESVSHGSRITNAAETTLTAHLVTTMIKSGVSPWSIGVITFYRSQLALLRQEIQAISGSSTTAELEIYTADKFQGRDKEVVILSCVRNNDANHIGELLKDWRRVNVAVTRGKSKLLIIGSKSTLGNSKNNTLEGLVKIMDERGWTLDLPSNALDAHAFEGSTQGTGKLLGGSIETNEPKRRSPLQPTSRNASPAKKGLFRKPTRVVKGVIDLEKLIEKRPVIRDIVNEVVDDMTMLH